MATSCTVVPLTHANQLSLLILYCTAGKNVIDVSSVFVPLSFSFTVENSCWRIVSLLIQC